MLESNSRSYRALTAALIYLTVIAGALIIATLRSRATSRSSPSSEVETLPSDRRTSHKPFFSLSTHRTYGTGEAARIWIDYQGVDHLDFRIYQVKHPLKFFIQLSDAHQMGGREEEELAGSLQRRPSFLERVRTLKRWAYGGIQAYVRAQLQRDSRKTFNQKFRSEETPSRFPLDV
jgi:hypothetical protein